MTLAGKRTHDQSVFTQKCSQGVSQTVPFDVPGIVQVTPAQVAHPSLERLTPSLDDTIAAFGSVGNGIGMACSRYRSGTGAYGNVSGACEVHIHYQIIMFRVWGEVERKCHYAWNVFNLPLFSTHTLVG